MNRAVRNGNKARILKARYLILVKELTQKEVAEIVGVSENTMTAWARRYNWYDKIHREITSAGGLQMFMEDFFIELEAESREISIEVKKRWYNYLKKYEAQINI